MSEERLNEPQTAMEAALASLRWRPSSLDRGRLMYLAGQASVRGPKGALGAGRPAWIWPLVTAVSLLVAVALGGVLLSSEGPRVVERVVYVPVERAADSTAVPEPTPAVRVESRGSPLRTDYLVLRHVAITRGLDDAMAAAPGIVSPERKTLTPADAYRGSIDWDGSG